MAVSARFGLRGQPGAAKSSAIAEGSPNGQIQTYFQVQNRAEIQGARKLVIPYQLDNSGPNPLWRLPETIGQTQAAILLIVNPNAPTGHLNPIDGQYHWQGTILDATAADFMANTRTVGLSVGALSASARIIEKTPQGTHSIAGVGAPPFSRNNAELTAPPR